MLKLIISVCICLTFSACGQQNKKLKTPSPKAMAGVNIPIDTNWTEKVVKSDAEWKKSLTEKQYYILRKHGTHYFLQTLSLIPERVGLVILNPTHEKA